MAKSLFSLLFLFGPTIQGRSVGKCYITMSHITVTCQDITESYHIIILHNKYRKIVYRLYSSYISNI